MEIVFNTVKNILAKGEQVELRGFGKFTVREKNQRIGRNPRTGEEAEISARRVVTFKPSKLFRVQPRVQLFHIFLVLVKFLQAYPTLVLHQLFIYYYTYRFINFLSKINISYKKRRICYLPGTSIPSSTLFLYSFW